MAAGLAGCTGGGNGSNGLDFWLFGGTPAEREYISSHYSNYDGGINYQHQEWGQKYQIIASAAANDNLPDVMAGQAIEIPDYVGADAIEPLDGDGFEDRLTEINEIFVDANIDALRYSDLGDYDGERQYALPGGYADMGPFVDIRTDYMEQTSFDEPPRTWSELVQLAEEMQELDEIDAAVTTSGNDQGLTAGYFIGFVYANGGRYYDPDSLEATIDEQGFVDAVKLYEELASNDLFPGSIAENDHIKAGRRLINGSSGIFITYSHANAVMETIDAPDEWYDGEGHTVTRAPLPEEPSGSFEPRDLLIQNAQAFMLARGTDGDDEYKSALEYLEWWNSEDQLAPWTGSPDTDVGIRGRVPTLQSAFDDPPELMETEFGDLVTLYEEDNLFTNTARFPSFPGLASVQSIINRNVLQPVMLGEATAEEACSDANEQVQGVIDDELA
ncbi:ABC transporter substrate-binding protein [Halosolutus gelatinilyticus]|uniref:ABC transporter substrate-binding protein n=1 Tax=Halosolutus gelatinilyticus TaxID=2931975 RepID=UPI0031F30F7F